MNEGRHSPVLRKRRHHYVWQHYLKPWTRDGALFCLSDGKICPRGTRVVAIKTDFYKVENISEAEARFIYTLTSKNVHPLTQKLNSELLQLILAPLRIARAIPGLATNPDFTNFIADYQANTIEDYHTATENRFIPILSELQQGNTNSYHAEDQVIGIIHYLCMQIMRTKALRDRSVAALKANVGVDLSRSWPLVGMMMANNLGANLYLERSRRTLSYLENKTDVHFITGDQPIVNLYVELGQQSQKLSLYYPVSPRGAVILSEEDQPPLFDTNSLSIEKVERLNKIMANASHQQLFGDSRDVLEPHRKREAQVPRS